MQELFELISPTYKEFTLCFPDKESENQSHLQHNVSKLIGSQSGVFLIFEQQMRSRKTRQNTRKLYVTWYDGRLVWLHWWVTTRNICNATNVVSTLEYGDDILPMFIMNYIRSVASVSVSQMSQLELVNLNGICDIKLEYKERVFHR